MADIVIHNMYIINKDKFDGKINKRSIKIITNENKIA